MDINQEILTKAKLLWRNGLTADAELVLCEFCSAAYFELSRRLKEEISVDMIREQFVRAAAALAVSMFIELEPVRVESFSAGGLSVKGPDAKTLRESAQSLRRQAELMLAGFLKEQSFHFKAVRG